jgi:hypothetical protein
MLYVLLMYMVLYVCCHRLTVTTEPMWNVAWLCHFYN